MDWRHGGGPHNLLLLLGQISREVLDARRAHPVSIVRDFDLAEDFREREVAQLALSCLFFVRCDRRDVHEARDAVVGSGDGNGGPSVRVAYEKGRARDAPESANNAIDVPSMTVESILGGDHVVSLRPKRRDQLAEARTVSPNAVTEDNALDW